MTHCFSCCVLCSLLLFQVVLQKDRTLQKECAFKHFSPSRFSIQHALQEIRAHEKMQQEVCPFALAATRSCSVYRLLSNTQFVGHSFLLTGFYFNASPLSPGRI